MSDTFASGNASRQSSDRSYPRRRTVAGLVALLGAIAIGTAWYFSAWRTLFFHAIRTDNIGLVRVMLKLGTDPNRAPKESFADTPLTAAVHTPRNNLAMVRLLLEFHADPNLPRPDGATPLGCLWPDGFSTEVLDALLGAGADIKACSQNHAILHHRTSRSLAEVLLSRGADPSQVCDAYLGDAPLSTVVRYPEVVALYLEHGAKIIPDSHKNTPLHRVAEIDATEADRLQHGAEWSKSAELLLAHGADVNAVNSTGKTPLDYAYEKGNKDIAALLLKHGAKALKFKSMEEGEESHAAKDEYEDLLMFSDNEGKGPRCSLSLTGENRNTMEEGNEWSIVKGTIGVVRVNCHASGYFHYAVLGMGPPAPKRVNMSLAGAASGSAKISFNEKWSRGIMHWYYSESAVTNLAKAVKQGKATQFAIRYVTVGE